MVYIPDNTYKNLPSKKDKYNAILREICYQSKEAQRLRNKVASFDEKESRVARDLLKKIVEHILYLRQLGGVGFKQNQLDLCSDPTPFTLQHQHKQQTSLIY